MKEKYWIAKCPDPVLITGSNGFIGARVVQTLLEYGFTNLRCLVRQSSDVSALNRVLGLHPAVRVEIVTGNLLSKEDCRRITKDARIVYHLAAAIKDTSFESSYMNNVETTRNLLSGAGQWKSLRRFVNVSSIAVYSNWNLKRGALMDELCDRETDPLSRGDAYCNAKIIQEDLVASYCQQHGISYAVLRPGVVYGPGNRDLHRRIGKRIGGRKFGVFLHLGGTNQIPLSYVDNCAEAIVLAGLEKSADGQTFNVVDDDLPSSRTFLRLYKRHIRTFKSVSVPYGIIYAASWIREKYSHWSTGRIPRSFNRRKCAAAWKGNRFSNRKLKELLGWTPKVSFDEALRRYCMQKKNGVARISSGQGSSGNNHCAASGIHPGCS